MHGQKLAVCDATHYTEGYCSGVTVGEIGVRSSDAVRGRIVAPVSLMLCKSWTVLHPGDRYALVVQLPRIISGEHNAVVVQVSFIELRTRSSAIKRQSVLK